MNATIKNLLLWMVILVLIILAWNVFKTGAMAVEEVTFSQFLDQVGQGHVQRVKIRGEEISGTYAPVGRQARSAVQDLRGQLPRPRQGSPRQGRRDRDRPA